MLPPKAKSAADRPAKLAEAQGAKPNGRLSAALRDNLKRRKAQQRARAQGAAGPAPQSHTAEGDQGE